MITFLLNDSFPVLAGTSLTDSININLCHTGIKGDDTTEDRQGRRQQQENWQNRGSGEGNSRLAHAAQFHHRCSTLCVLYLSSEMAGQPEEEGRSQSDSGGWEMRDTY